MLKQLANIIEKKPLLIIIIVLLITAGFATFLPQIEMKTEFKDFMPEEESVMANKRVTDYFGQRIQTMFLYASKQKAESTISPDALREMYYIEKNLKNTEYVNNTISVTTFLDQICQIEYGEGIDGCSNKEINTVLDDLTTENIGEKINFFEKDDPNEEIDYVRFPRLSKGQSIDSADIKNGFTSYNNEDITFTIEVYDLSEFESDLKPPIGFTNVFEWYIDFSNKLPIFEELDIDYKISAHIEPRHPIWVYGDGIINNLRNLINHIKNKELGTYEKNVFLWLKPPDQEMYFPLPLETGKINFDKTNNQIQIKVSREEIGNYGIATEIGSFGIPAKLGNFEIGTRYFRNPIGLPWQRIEANTSFLFEKIKKIQNRPIIGNIADRLIKKITDGEISLYDFDEFFNMSNEDISISDRIALIDIENSWTNLDTSNVKSTEKNVLFIRPNFFNDLETATKGFVSKDYENNKKPAFALVLIELNRIEGYDKIIEINKGIIDEIRDLDDKYDYISIKATGDGVITAEINEVTSEANRFIGPAIFIIIFIILLLNFRKISYVVLPMFTLLISTIWLFGTLVILGMDFSVMQVALVPLIMGLGVDYAVHMFHNYRVEIDKGKAPSEAIKISVTEIGNAMFLAMITTVIAFMSFLTATVPAIKDFGILLGLGVAYTFITAITILPAFRYLLDREKTNLKSKKLKIFDVSFIMEKVAAFVLQHNKKILVIMIIVSVFFAANAINLDTGFDIEQFAPQDTPSIELFEDISKNFPSATQNQEYILIEGNIATVGVLEGIYKTQKNFNDNVFIAKNPDGSLKTNSILKVIQTSIKNNESLIEEFNINKETGIPRTDKDVKNLFDYFYEKQKSDFNDFNMETIEMSDIQNIKEEDIQMQNTVSQVKNVLHRNDRGRYDATLIRIYITFQLNGQQKIDDTLETLQSELMEDVQDYGNAEAIVTGQNIITLKITNSLTESQILSTGVSIILAIIVLIIAYKNPLLGFVAMIPVGITIIWVLGTMYLIGYTLNALTITITSITIGIGIDYSIHATERFRLVADKTGDIEKAMCETISHTGGALLIAALTTACGFGILAFAPIPPQQQFGVILSITIVYSLLTAILILPSVLVRWAELRRDRIGYIVTTNGMKKVNGKWVKDKKSAEKEDSKCKK